MPIKDPIRNWAIGLMLGDNVAVHCGKSDPSLLRKMLQDNIIVHGLFPAITPEDVRCLLALWYTGRVMRGIWMIGASCGHISHHDSGVAKTNSFRACISDSRNSDDLPHSPPYRHVF